MNRKVRAIIVDGTEIMTSLTAVEIADRLRTYDDLKDEVNRKDNIINEFEKYFEEKYNDGYEKLYVEDVLYELEELKESANNEG